MQLSLSAALAQALSRLTGPAAPAKPAAFQAEQQGAAQGQTKRASGHFDAEMLKDPARLPTNGPIRRGMIVDILV
ncbi:MAG: hypothetical protein GVY13_02080 [Alphaproteobacteria bacterium]|jgi:hypothetical protein|nr:hypothetical protein [Alphaproteobacteria bacterium]